MSRKSTSRRAFLKAMGAGTACAGLPGVSFARRGGSEESGREILDGASERIEKHRKGQAALTLTGPDGRPLPAGTNVEVRQTRHKFLFGCNIFKLGRCRTPEDNAAYAGRFASLLNFATLPFYWWSYERQRGEPRDGRTEEIIRWCKVHGITPKGHPLAWNWAEPPWLTGTPDEAMELQIKRIGRCVERFEGDINIWDVVNEATHYDRDRTTNQAPRLTEAISRMGVGEYLRAAFRTARKANPDATLLINDYRNDRPYAEKVIAELVDENGKAMYDVIGLQSHMHSGYPGAARWWDVCERYAKFEKPLHFTETTFVSGPKNESGWTTTPEGEQRQAEWAAEFYTLLFSHPAVEAITWWDFSDQGAWQQAPAGLLRDDMTPKPVYDRLHDLIKGQWWTTTTVEAGSNGRTDFDGFLGQYEAEAGVGGRRLFARFTLNRSGPLDVQFSRP